MTHLANRAAAMGFGAVLALALLAIAPWWIDEHVDAVWNEDHRIVVQDDGRIVLRISGEKPRWRDLPLRTRPAYDELGEPIPCRGGEAVSCVPGEQANEIVPPVGWAVSADGYRRKIRVEGVDGNVAKDYPPGRSDFGQWAFLQPNAKAPPIVALELEIFQEGWFGPRSEILGRFPVR